MLALSSSMGAKEIYVGQVLNPYFVKVETPWGIRIQKDSIIPFMGRMNDMAKAICLTDSTCTYLDFETTLPWTAKSFWDDMHFTKEGNEMFAEALRKEIINVLQ